MHPEIIYLVGARLPTSSIEAGALIEDQFVICWLSWLLEMASEHLGK
jgi:hypothetical protein